MSLPQSCVIHLPEDHEVIEDADEEVGHVRAFEV